MISTAPISVIIPAYNAERFIRQAIRSVQNQTVKVSEVIVVDDHSNDRTAEIAREMGAIVLEKPYRNQGTAAARNRGINAAGGDWIALLDADDFWEKSKIEYQWQAIQDCPDAGIISCYSRIFRTGPVNYGKEWDQWIKLRKYDGDIKPLKINKYCSYYPTADWLLFNSINLHTSSVILKKEVFSVVGMFEESFPIHDETELFLRILGKFPLVVVKRRLSSYRRHENNFSETEGILADNMPALIEKIMRSPENYPPGVYEFYLEFQRQHFLKHGAKLAQELRDKKLTAE